MHEAERGEAVRRIAREADPDRSLSALFAPREARVDLFALYALNAELSRVAELVSEPGLGAIRLQWWRDAIERAASGEAIGHPVADAFGETLRHRKLSRNRVSALIDARNFDVETKIMPDMATLDTYLGHTAGTVFALAAEILGARGESVEQAARSAGKAYGLTGLIRALPVHAARGLIFLPEDALLRCGTSPGEVLAGKMSQGLHDLLAELRVKAREALRDARSRIAALDHAARSAFVSLSLVDPYLASLEKKGRDPLHEIADINPLYRLWRLARWR
ncbi:MAG TPA: phytoene/squalene synthase family protein [Methyloceanibacter sp.]|nr:phytoene/squalene synthase family protein [Methyloceanibacter sp.]